MRFPAYPKYRPSRGEGLDTVPEHWDIKPLKSVVRARDEKVEATVESPLPFVGLENIEPRTGRLLPLDDGVIPTGIASRFQPDDVLFGKLRPYLAKACRVTFSGLCSSELLVLTGRSVHREFLLYQLLSDHFIQLVDSSTYGVKMPRANWEFIGSCPVCLPPPCEQGSIVEFLNAQTSRIDRLIARKRVLAETLEEKRLALIHLSATGKAGPCVSSQIRSGEDDFGEHNASIHLEWTGALPPHWSTSKIKFVARVESGHTPSRAVEEYWQDCTIPWVSLNDSRHLRNHDSIAETAHNINELGIANSSARVLPAGTIVFSRDATIGLCAMTTRPMAVSQHFVAYLCGPRLLPEFLLIWLKAMNQHLERLSLGATIPTIGMDDVRALRCALPPVEEQLAIVAGLRRETAKLNQLSERVKKAIDRLYEYRAALITAAVTGQIDVRGFAP